MRQLQKTLTIATRGRSIVDITRDVADVVRQSDIGSGLCVVFIRHTSASLLIQENADQSVLMDLERWMNELAPESRRWAHDTEGQDDMPAHAKCTVTRTSETIPVQSGRLALGTWQGLFLWEHRARPHNRTIIVHVMGV